MFLIHRSPSHDVAFAKIRKHKTPSGRNARDTVLITQQVQVKRSPIPVITRLPPPPTATLTIQPPPSKGHLVLQVSWRPGCGLLACWLLTPGLAHSLAPAASISLIMAMKAAQTETLIRTN